MGRFGSARIFTAIIAMLVLAIVAAMLGSTGSAAWLVAIGGIIVILFATGETGSAQRALPETTPAIPNDTEALLEAMAEPVLIVADGRISSANSAARALLGSHIVGEDARLAFRHPAAAERLASGTPDPSEAIDLVGIGGRESRWEMRIGTLTGNRRVIRLIDRTGSYATERMRVDFVANASHELRTPLAAILGFVETLSDDKAGDDPATRKRFLKVVHDEAHRMQRLVDDLMSLSRIEAEKYRIPDAAVDLTKLIGEVHGVLRDNGGDRGKDIVVEIAEDVSFISGDRAQLSQLVHNLVGNAMKYGRHGTPVTVRLDRGTGSMMRLSVTDEGEGIAPEHLPRLTERFYRVDSSRSRALGGTGLGLAIVKHIVERHRGRLDIASKLGVGTTVTILLPPAPIPLSSKSHISVTERD